MRDDDGWVMGAAVWMEENKQAWESFQGWCGQGDGLDTGGEEVGEDQVGLRFPALEEEMVWGGRHCIRALLLEQRGATWCNKMV